MENASKALIIAGAILLAILIISLGILIYNQASSVVNGNAMTQVEIQQFNQQFTQYEGTSVRGSAVRSLYQAVLANNVSQDSDDKRVSISGPGSSSLGKSSTEIPSSLYTDAATGSTYSVTCSYGDDGLVDSISIQ